MSYTIEFCQYLLCLRKARTSDSENELELLGRLASGCRLVVEVGVFEGVASARMAANLSSNGRLILVDPYVPGVLVERLFAFSMAETIARRTLAPFAPKTTWIRKESAQAAGEVSVMGRADLIFIDARHEYESVAEDFRMWSPLLSGDGVIAFHDSRVCAGRRDLDALVGSVRFVSELAQGRHGPWKVVEVVDSITVVRVARVNNS